MATIATDGGNGDWVHFSMRMPPDLHDAVKEKATQEDRTMASAVRSVLRKWVAGHPSLG